MLVMTNYAKKYASTIYQSLVSSTPPPFWLNDRPPLPFLIKLANKQLRHFGGEGEVIKIAFSFILIQYDLRFSTDTKHFN